MSPEEARYAALRKFGNVTRVKEDTWEVWSFVWLEQLWQDIRFGLRMLAKNPGFTVVAVLTLALGVGGVTAGFSVLYEAVLKSLPYSDPQRVVAVHNFFPTRQIVMAGVSGFDYAEIAQHKDLFSSAGVFYWNDVTLTGAGDARHVNVVNASAGLFRVLGVNARMGRTFAPADDQFDAPKVALLSEAFWRDAFGADSAALGRDIRLNQERYRIIGVMPGSFQFPSAQTQVWIPLAEPPTVFTLTGKPQKWLHMLARLAPGISERKAESGLNQLSAALASQFPAIYGRGAGWQFIARPLADENHTAVRRWVYLAFGAVFAVWLIACVNVSGLLLIRAASRSAEVAMRMALGATKTRIARQMLAEAGVLVIVGCLLGLLFASESLHLINLCGPLAQHASIHVQVLLFFLALTVAGTVCAGLVPAVFSMHSNLDSSLRGGTTRTATRGAGYSSGIVTVQIAVAVVLLVAGIALGRSFLSLTRVDPGFDPGRVWTGALDLARGDYTANESWNSTFYEPLLARLAALPGIEVASGGVVPFNPSGIWTDALRFPGRLQFPQEHPEAQISPVLPGYFEAMRIPLLRGRTFTFSDRVDAPPVAVVDEELRRRYFPEEDPIGKLIASGPAGAPAQIVGVVGSVLNSDLAGSSQPEIYYPELQRRSFSMFLVLRVSTEADPTAQVRQAISSLNAGVALYDVASMDARLAESLKLRRFVAAILSGFASAGITLAAIGLYASLAWLVELRRREIAVRFALGATRVRVAWMVAARSVLVIVPGIAAGIAAAELMGGVLRSQMSGVHFADLLTYAGALGVLLLAAAVATGLPAWRAAKVDPTVSLRHE